MALDTSVEGHPADPATDRTGGVSASAGFRKLPWARVGAVFGVLIPFALLVRYATVTGPSFDGAMNLQVAENLSNGLGYVRFYGELVEFPFEIQTSGAYIFLAAAFIKVFGGGTFVYELPNLLFLGLLLVSVSYGLRSWPVLRTIGPFIVLFATPGMVENSMKGYGEYVVAALVIAAFVLVGAAAAGNRRPVLAVGTAFALIGVALTVKIIALLALPVLLLGLVGVALARPAVRRSGLAATVLCTALPLILVELHRLVSLGPADYVSYWTNLLGFVGAQAGVSEAAGITPDSGVGPVRKIADHVHLLSVATGINPVLLLLALGLPFITLIALFVTRQLPWQRWLALPGTLLAVMLASYAGGYLIWWLAITPTSKAWLRRLVIALIAIVFLALLLAGMAKDSWNARSTTAESNPRSLLARTGWAIVAVLAVVCLLPAVTTMSKQVRSIASADSSSIDSAERLAQAASSLAAEGNTMYGSGWWSAPVVALYGDISLGNLETVSACDPATGIPSGNAYLVWDFYAVAIASKVPQSTRYDFTELPDSKGRYGAIWKITPKPTVTC